VAWWEENVRPAGNQPNNPDHGYLTLDQAEFVAWWEENVRPAGQGRIVPDLGQFLLVEAAEELSGISKQKVSKWRGRLRDAAGQQPGPAGDLFRPSGVVASPGQTTAAGSLLAGWPTTVGAWRPEKPIAASIRR
jgi:hypothetical protein